MDHFTQNAKPTSGLDKMMLCDLNPDDPNITTKTISLTFHIFQKDDGTGNITEAEGWTAINYRLVNAANQHFANLQPMSFSSPSLYFQDAKIRFDVEERYFWKNTTMWGKGDNTIPNGEAMYNYIINQPEVVNKHNTIHVFIPGDDSTDPNAIKGIASNIGPYRPSNVGSGIYSWSLLSNVYRANNTGNSPGQASNLRHEIGHNLSLWHTWQEGWTTLHASNVQLPDTPPSSGVWNNGSNNMMDYNPHQIAITVDQFTRMHDYLADHPEIVVSGYQAPESDLSYYLSSSNSGTFSGNVDFGAPSGTVDVLNNSDSPFNWTILGSGTAPTVNIYNNGADLSFYGLGWMTMQVDWTDKCREHTDVINFYNTAGYYRAAPNSGNTDLVDIIGLDEDGNNKSFGGMKNGDNQIVAVTLADALGRMVSYNNLNVQRNENISLDWSGLNKGIILGSLVTRDGRKFPLKTIKH